MFSNYLIRVNVKLLKMCIINIRAKMNIPNILIQIQFRIRSYINRNSIYRDPKVEK